MTSKQVFILLVALLLAAVAVFSYNSAQIHACDIVGGTTVTNFGFVIDCKTPSLFP